MNECKMTNCIFTCVFGNDVYLQLTYILIDSIRQTNKDFHDIDILIYTTSEFENKIRQHESFCNSYIKFVTTECKTTIDEWCKARMDIFDFGITEMYEKILYVDTDVIICGDLHKIFDVCTQPDVLYALPEDGTYDITKCINRDYFGAVLFSKEELQHVKTGPFNSGVLLFHTSERIKSLFNKTRIKSKEFKTVLQCYDQPYINYVFATENAVDLTLLQTYARYVGTDTNVKNLGEFIVNHYYGNLGNAVRKYERMLADYIRWMESLGVMYIKSIEKHVTTQIDMGMIINFIHFSGLSTKALFIGNMRPNDIIFAMICLLHNPELIMYTTQDVDVLQKMFPDNIRNINKHYASSFDLIHICTHVNTDYITNVASCNCIIISSHDILNNDDTFTVPDIFRIENQMYTVKKCKK